MLVRKIVSHGVRNCFTLSSKISQHKFSTLIRPVHYRFSNEPNDQKQKLSKEQIFKKKEQEMLNQSPEEDPSSYDKSSSNLGAYLMGISFAALCFVYGMMQVQTLRTKSKMDKSVTGITKVQSTGKAKIGGTWQLTDTKGKKYGSKDLEGSYYLIYFGFTNCPDICPNSLIKLARAIERLKKMPQAQYVSLKTIFVSVDPDRDNAQKIQKFLKYFSEDFIGVTGASNNDPDLRECMKKFKIYASKIEFEDEETMQKGRKSYTIDHTILTYLMNDRNEYVAHLGANLGEHELAKTILDKILDNEHSRMRMMKV